MGDYFLLASTVDGFVRGGNHPPQAHYDNFISETVESREIYLCCKFLPEIYLPMMIYLLEGYHNIVWGVAS